MTTAATPNHALQRTAPSVTAPASTAAFPPTMQVPRRPQRSLSLGSLASLPASGDSMSQMLQMESRRILALPVWIRVHRFRTKDLRAQAQTQFRLRLCFGARGYRWRDYTCVPGARSMVLTWSRPLMGCVQATNEPTPNQALQRTAAAVTLAAPPPSPAQPSRQPPPSLSLGSLLHTLSNQIHTNINIYGFACTAGIGVLLLALLLWATRASTPRSRSLRALACAIAALSFTPTAFPFALNLGPPGVPPPAPTLEIEPALFLIVLGISQGFNLFLTLIALVPILGVFALLYGVWDLSQSRNA